MKTKVQFIQFCQGIIKEQKIFSPKLSLPTIDSLNRDLIELNIQAFWGRLLNCRDLLINCLTMLMLEASQFYMFTSHSRQEASSNLTVYREKFSGAWTVRTVTPSRRMRVVERWVQ